MKIRYSVVVPVYNEEGSVAPLEKSIREAMEPLKEKYEIIFVNDGSTDATLARLKELSKSNLHLNVVTLEKNSGQTASLRVGFEVARGDVIISMDGDLQNDAGDIPQFLSKIDMGYDVVCGWRRKRHDSLWKKSASRIANIVQRAIFKSNLHDISCTLRAYKKDVLKGIDLSWSGAHRFIPYLLLSKAKRITEVEVTHHARKFGKSKYKPTKIFKTIIDFFRLLKKM